ncbi:hypothetical protein PHYPO_G00076160 [Pangasianodon hypophthalmus]|uniref:Fibronectin type-III domain-containing protein n=1 Tax=Pangasianodon hypophthalmus TaxID=310915 RepID=A0A5N5LKF6_PANHP|nr:interleukin 2 receptor, gamma a [Pangasianodon hypophthalmus]KAB5543174.1 hypothetical protein PHYPO_G00076160 [Pangasianodon hypophthalmus]
MFLSSFLTFVWICSGSASSPHQIECMVVNLEYVSCTWDGDGTVAENYTFKSSYNNPDAPAECSSYQYVREVRVGCVVPYSEKKLQRFDEFHAWLYRDNITLAKQEYKNLLSRVKLNAPNNVSLLLRDPELWIYWNITSNAKSQCQERELRYRINGNKWSTYGTSMENAFNVPFPNAQSLYEFQVRVRIASTCGLSELWSEWSEPVFWGTTKKINDTETGRQTSAGLMVLCTVGAAVVLIVLACLLIHSERLRVILVPVVPSPKNLGDLIESYNGNVEKWLHISKELQDGFKPNFSERPCTVREFRTESNSESDSDDCLSVHTAVSSDYQSMQSYSSTSTLPSPSETPSTETTPLNGL